MPLLIFGVTIQDYITYKKQNMSLKEQKNKLREEIQLLTGRLEQLQSRLDSLSYSEMQEGDYHFASWYLYQKGHGMSARQVNSYASQVQGWKIKPEYKGKRKVYTRKCLDEAIERGFAPIQERKKYVYPK